MLDTKVYELVKLLFVEYKSYDEVYHSYLAHRRLGELEELAKSGIEIFGTQEISMCMHILYDLIAGYTDEAIEKHESQDKYSLYLRKKAMVAAVTLLSIIRKKYKDAEPLVELIAYNTDYSKVKVLDPLESPVIKEDIIYFIDLYAEQREKEEKEKQEEEKPVDKKVEEIKKEERVRKAPIGKIQVIWQKSGEINRRKKS